MTRKTRKKIKVPSGRARLRADIVEMAGDLAAVGLMGDDEVGKITMRLLDPDKLPEPPAVSGEEIAALRCKANMSQAVFARLFDVSTGTLSKWERDQQQPRGPARRLLHVIKQRGVAAVL